MMASRRPVVLVPTAFLLLVEWDSPAVAAEGEKTCTGIVPMKKRGSTVSVADFDGEGDGRTLNTAAFQKAVAEIERRRAADGTTLYVPPGVWLTGTFNLTSKMTFFLAKGAVIKAIKDTSSWSLIDPLPSYGRGREGPGGRYISLIHGNGVRDVIITGENGTIDGQGEVWWNMWRNKTLRFTRPHILEFMNSTDIIISNVVFQNSPFWNIHPVYCSNVVVTNVTVLAPHDSPNTDGVDPDSSSNVCIEDSYFSTGDDLIAVKSEWDEYGIAYGHPSSGIAAVRRLTGSTPFAGFAVGSEASGGVENILVENMHIFHSGFGVHIKTNTGRGGYVRNITISGVNMSDVRVALKIAGDVGGHPDDKYNPNALPVVNGLIIKNVLGVDIREPGLLKGIKKSAFTGICLSNIELYMSLAPAKPWQCEFVSGNAFEVQPPPCTELTSTSGKSSCGKAI